MTTADEKPALIWINALRSTRLKRANSRPTMGRLLETVPDLAGVSAANDLVGKTDAEVREVIGVSKHFYHSIVCIGALVAHCEPDHWAVDAVGPPLLAGGSPMPEILLPLQRPATPRIISLFWFKMTIRHSFLLVMRLTTRP